MNFYVFVPKVTQALVNAIAKVNNVRVELISSMVEELSVAGKSKDSNPTPYVYGLESEGCKPCSIFVPVTKEVETKEALLELIGQWFDFRVEAYEETEKKASQNIACGIHDDTAIDQRNAFRPNAKTKVPKRVSIKIDKIDGITKLDAARIEALRLEAAAEFEAKLKAEIANLASG